MAKDGPEATETGLEKLLILDLDTGIDDALALLYALRTPGVRVLSVGTVSGNTDARQAAINTITVLRVAGQSGIPVAVGCDRPLVEPMRLAPHIHGSDGLGNMSQDPHPLAPVAEHAVDSLIRLARQHAGQVTLVATAPLTNLALALRTEPRLVEWIDQVVIMGGAIGYGGNVNATAEANIGHDPEAAAVVLGASWPVTLVPLDATMPTRLTATEFERLRTAASPVAQFAYAMIQFYRRAYGSLLNVDAIPLHDPLAVGIALDPSLLLDAPLLPLTVELAGVHTRGMTVADRRTGATEGLLVGATPVRVCLRADSQRFVSMLMERLLET